MKQVEFTITQIADADIVDRVKAAVVEAGKNVVSVSLNVAEQDVPDNEVDKILALKALTCQVVALKLNSDESIRITRSKDQKRLLDTVYVAPKPGDTQVLNFASLVGALRRHLPDAAALSSIDILQEQDRQLFISRQNEINELQRSQLEFFNKFQDFALEQKKREDEYKQAVDEEAKKQRAELDKERTALKADVEATNAEFEEKQKQFDSRDATHVRRELREKLHAEIKSRQERFELTPGTKGRRIEVLIAWIVVLAALGALNVWEMWMHSQQQGDLSSTDFLLIYGRQTGLIVTFIVTSAFFLRWLNNWFSRHAEEEFRTKQLQLDVDRASWVFETALSWREEKDSPVPQYLIERLSRNLFAENEATDDSVTAADSLASALFGQSGRIKLLVSGNEIEVIRKGRRRPKQ